MDKKNIEKQVADYIIQFQENHYRIAFSYVKNSEDALDIVQESIYKALGSMNSIKNPAGIKTWFYRIVVNTSLDFLRKRKKIMLPGEDALAAFDLGSADSYQDFDLQKALDSLPDHCRTIVLLRYCEDLKLEEIAEIMNQNVNTIKTNLYKSLERLRIKMSV